MEPKSWLPLEIAFSSSMLRMEKSLTPKELTKIPSTVWLIQGMVKDGPQEVQTTLLLFGLQKALDWSNIRTHQRSNAFLSTQFCKVWRPARTQTSVCGNQRAKRFKNGQLNPKLLTVIGLQMARSLLLHFTMVTSCWETKVELNWPRLKNVKVQFGAWDSVPRNLTRVTTSWSLAPGTKSCLYIQSLAANSGKLLELTKNLDLIHVPFPFTQPASTLC